jgi:hypothetical protein
MMPIVFGAEPDPSTDLLETVAAMAPENPFYTPAYAVAIAMAGEQPWVLGLRDGGGRWLAACTGFLKRGRFSCWMGIRSLPALGANVATFWDGLFPFCRRLGVTHMGTNSYASIEASIPASPAPARRSERIEYVMDLGQVDRSQLLHQNHRRKVIRARKAGVQLRCSTSEADGLTHCQLIAASMRRREGRGEQVSTSIAPQEYLALLRAGAGVLSQAVKDGRILSSVLVLLSSQGAYYHSAGTDPEGMELGASQFLILETASDLQSRGFPEFNLGGASADNPGLQDFKARFGSVTRPLAAAEFDLQTRLRRSVGGVLRSLRDRFAGTLEH